MDIGQMYFEWLKDFVGADQQVRSYDILLLDLHHKQFVSYVDHDENRAFDGIELRDEFLEENRIGHMDWGGMDIDLPCSVLEMMIALARRMDFETSDPYEDETLGVYDKTAFWFWEMVNNLGLMEVDDDAYSEKWARSYVDAAVDTLVERRYSYSGDGGLFPLDYPEEDQRDIEIWYQMSAYLAEREG